LMEFHWHRLPRLLRPLGVAAVVAFFLMYELEVSRFWAVPGGLFVAVQLQKRNLV
jgi:hypothetical protein